jgi:uncharacterized RDD family membrane protein YckC
VTKSAAGEIAGLTRRLLSLGYEALLIAALALAGMVPFVILADGLDPAFKRPLNQVYLILLAGAYFVRQWTRGGQTLAMKTWRLKLVTREGAPLTLGQGIRRFAFALAGTALGGSGFAWALFDRDRQFLHDRLAGTRIVMTFGALAPFLPPEHSHRDAEENQRRHHRAQERRPVVEKTEMAKQPVQEVKAEAEHDTGKDLRPDPALPALEVGKRERQ